MESPTDTEIEHRLCEVPNTRWDELWAAWQAVTAEDEHATWMGGDVAGTTVIDGVERQVLRAPHVEYSTAVHRLTGAINGVGAVVPFPWMDWDGPGRLRGPRALDDAPVADAVRMLTAILRGERFSDGTIAAALEDGTLEAALRRLRRWRVADHCP